MMSYEDRKRLLLSEFELIDTNHDYIFSKADLIRYLDEKNGSIIQGGYQFDRHLANELFDKMEKDKDDRVSVNEFLKIWDECHDNLRTSIETCQARIKLANESKAKLQEQLNQLQKNRGTENSQPTLRLVIKEARSINMDLFCVAVKLGNQIRCTSNFGGKTASVPIGEYIEFPLNETGPDSREYVTFTVTNMNNGSESSLEGTFGLGVLNDQLKHDVWINLQETDGFKKEGRIAVTMQHLYSEEKYYQNLVAHWDQYVKTQEQELAKNQNYVKQINNPNNFLLTVAHGDFYIKRLKPTQDLTGFTGIDQAYNHRPIEYAARIHPMEALALVFGLLIICTCLLNLAFRAAFDSCFVGGLLIGFFYLGLNKTVQGALITAGVNLIALIMNVTWFFLHYKEFWSGNYIDSATLLGPRKWEVVLSLILIGLEVLAMILIYRLYWIAQRSLAIQRRSDYVNAPGGPNIGFATSYNANNIFNQWNTASADGFFIERPRGYNPGFNQGQGVATNPGNTKPGAPTTQQQPPAQPQVVNPQGQPQPPAQSNPANPQGAFNVQAPKS